MVTASVEKTDRLCAFLSWSQPHRSADLLRLRSPQPVNEYGCRSMMHAPGFEWACRDFFPPFSPFSGCGRSPTALRTRSRQGAPRRRMTTPDQPDACLLVCSLRRTVLAFPRCPSLSLHFPGQLGSFMRELHVIDPAMCSPLHVVLCSLLRENGRGYPFGRDKSSLDDKPPLYL
jgi:hypothetical protein